MEIVSGRQTITFIGFSPSEVDSAVDNLTNGDAMYVSAKRDR